MQLYDDLIRATMENSDAIVLMPGTDGFIIAHVFTRNSQSQIRLLGRTLSEVFEQFLPINRSMNQNRRRVLNRGVEHTANGRGSRGWGNNEIAFNRSVMYVDDEGREYAATIVNPTPRASTVNGGTGGTEGAPDGQRSRMVTLHIYYDEEMTQIKGRPLDVITVPYSKDFQPNSWHWPWDKRQTTALGTGDQTQGFESGEIRPREGVRSEEHYYDKSRTREHSRT